MHFNKVHPEIVYYNIFKFLEKELTKETGIYLEFFVSGVRFPYEDKVILYSKKDDGTLISIHFFLEEIDKDYFKNLKNKTVGFLYVLSYEQSYCNPEYLASDLTEISVI